MRNIGVLLASGSGSRIGGNVPKQFLRLNDKYIFEYSLKTFNDHVSIDEIVVVVRADYVEPVKNLVREKKYSKVVRVVPGGETRQESVFNGIFTIGIEEANVLIHDTARPFVTPEMIDRVIEGLDEYTAVTTVLPSNDTVFSVDEIGRVNGIPERSFIKRVQTPQGFYLRLLKKAHFMAQKDNLNLATDDCSLIRHYDLGDVLTVKGDDLAYKITSPLDLVLAKVVVNNLSVLNSD